MTGNVATALQIAMASGLAVALVHAYFERREGKSWRSVARTFFAWLLAFALAGLAGPIVASWLLTYVF